MNARWLIELAVLLSVVVVAEEKEYAGCVPVSTECQACSDPDRCLPWAASVPPTCTDCCARYEAGEDPPDCLLCKYPCNCKARCGPGHCDGTSKPQPRQLETCEWFDEGACCDVVDNEHLSHFTLPSLHAVFTVCDSCRRNLDRIVCAAVCSPDQALFFEASHNPEMLGTLYLCDSLCQIAYLSCEEETSWAPESSPISHKYASRKPTPWESFCEGSDVTVQTLKGQLRISVVPFNSSALPTGLQCLDIPMLYGPNEVHDQGATDGISTDEEEGHYYPKQYCDSAGEKAHGAGMTLLLTSIPFVVGGLIGNVLHKHHIHFISESAVMIILGVVYGVIATVILGNQAVSNLLFNREVFTLLLLPPIIFESGYTLRQQKFLANLDAILVHAIVGTLVATVFMGTLLHLCSPLFATSDAAGPLGKIRIFDWLTFGALISAVDPVATLATFNSLRVPKDLEVLVFGEALINDAVAIVLFKTFKKFLQYSQAEPTWSSGFASFFGLVFGSTFMGIAIGVFTSILFRLARFDSDNAILETVTFVVITWSSFVVAELLHLSGIISALVCGMICEHYAYRNLSAKGKVFTVLWYKQVSAIADMGIFFMIGMYAVVTYQDFDLVLLGITLLLLLVGRALTVYPLQLLINCCRSRERQIPAAHSVVMWASGLRGAIAIALAIEIPSPMRHSLTSVTVSVAILTVFVFGGFTSPLLKLLKIETGIEEAPKKLRMHSRRSVARMTGWKQMDNKYIKTLLVRSDGRSRKDTVPTAHEADPSYMLFEDEALSDLDTGGDPAHKRVPTGTHQPKGPDAKPLRSSLRNPAKAADDARRRGGLLQTHIFDTDSVSPDVHASDPHDTSTGYTPRTSHHGASFDGHQFHQQVRQSVDSESGSEGGSNGQPAGPRVAEEGVTPFV